MPLGTEYAQQDCSLARTLEVVGERWTLLILRDCFLGVRRFADFAAHLDISKAVLTERLGSLVDAGLLRTVPRGARHDYVLTERGLSLWPVTFTMTQWGEQHLAPRGPTAGVRAPPLRRGKGEPSGRCPVCGQVPGPGGDRHVRGAGRARTAHRRRCVAGAAGPASSAGARSGAGSPTWTRAKNLPSRSDTRPEGLGRRLVCLDDWRCSRLWLPGIFMMCALMCPPLARVSVAAGAQRFRGWEMTGGGGVAQ